MKRVFDVILSFLLLIILSLLFLVIAVLIKLDSKGPVFYKQERLGKNGREFTLYKFRTMINNIEKVPVLAEKNDYRATKSGKFLRRGLDELPQLWNILKGDMSFVGPRAERRYFNNKFTKKFKDWNKRLSVEQGITGLAQINNASSSEPERKLKCDLEYIKNKSFLLDIKILEKTLIILLRNYFRKV